MRKRLLELFGYVRQKLDVFECLWQRFPTGGTRTPWGTQAVTKGYAKEIRTVL